MFDCGFSFYKYMNNPYMGGCFCNHNMFAPLLNFSLFSNFMNMSFMRQAPPAFMMPYTPQTIFQMPLMQSSYQMSPIYSEQNSLINFQPKAANMYNVFESSYKSQQMKDNNWSISSSSKTKKGKALKKTEVVELACKIARKHGVDERLVLAVIDKESDFRNNLTSPAGAKGLMQLMPGTAKDLGVTDPMDPEQNIDGGVRLLKRLLKKYNGNVAYACAAYNWGEGNFDDWRAGKMKMPAETKDYMKIADYYENYSVA